MRQEDDKPSFEGYILGIADAEPDPNDFSLEIELSGVRADVAQTIFSQEVLTALTLEDTQSEVADPKYKKLSEQEQLALGILPHAPRKHYSPIERGEYVFILHEVLAGVLQFETARVEKPQIVDLITVTNELIEVNTTDRSAKNPNRPIRSIYNNTAALLLVRQRLQAFKTVPQGQPQVLAKTSV
ncbi:MAG: hypothetical protein AAB532_02350 [Patescibacteria group bacterium]